MKRKNVNKDIYDPYYEYDYTSEFVKEPPKERSLRQLAADLYDLYLRIRRCFRARRKRRF